MHGDLVEESNALIAGTCGALGWPALAGDLRVRAGAAFEIAAAPAMAAESLGARPEPAAVAALGCLTHAFKLVDCLLDDEPRPGEGRLGDGDIANRAQAATALAYALLDALPVEAALRLRAVQATTRMIAPFCLAQEGSVRLARDERSYWRTVEATTGRLIGHGLWLGALAARGDGEEWPARLAGLGRDLAQLLQINDDLLDAIKQPEESDWSGRTLNLAILYAETVDHPEREELLAAMREGRALGEHRRMAQILFSSGAVSYAVDSLLRRHQAFTARLDAVGPPERAPLEEAAFDLIKPALYLLEYATGKPAAEALDRDLGPFVAKKLGRAA